jgi:excisionase family DNA binding protein
MNILTIRLERAIFEAVAEAIDKQLKPLLQPLLKSTSSSRKTDEYLTTPKAAELLRLSPITLAIWRHQGRGPEYILLGRSVRYKRSTLEQFLESNKRMIGRKGRPPGKPVIVKTSGSTHGPTNSEAVRSVSRVTRGDR